MATLLVLGSGRLRLAEPYAAHPVGDLPVGATRRAPAWRARPPTGRRDLSRDRRTHPRGRASASAPTARRARSGATCARRTSWSTRATPARATWSSSTRAAGTRTSSIAPIASAWSSRSTPTGASPFWSRAAVSSTAATSIARQPLTRRDERGEIANSFLRPKRLERPGRHALLRGRDAVRHRAHARPMTQAAGRGEAHAPASPVVNCVEANRQQSCRPLRRNS